MARWIAAAVKIESHSGCFFLERETGSGLSEDDKRKDAVDARAAATFRTGRRMKMLRGTG
jgi:hypothetical protein